MSVATLIQTYKKKGLKAALRFLRQEYFPADIIIKKFPVYKAYFNGKNGIEIGGPSPIFSREIPIYPIVGSLDGCNFSNQTIWEGAINEGNNFNYFEGRKGFQYICEASNLSQVASGQYDFLVASHCLEHCANALKTVEEWARVVKPGGAILLVLPDRRFTFDHYRKPTTIEHLRHDRDLGIDETDLTHLAEIIEKHDLTMDRPAGTPEQFKARSLDNFHNRCLHHHVFDFDLLKKVYAENNIEVIDTTFSKPFHQIILGIKR
jgi:SAM-dependent methyltransferase